VKLAYEWGHNFGQALKHSSNEKREQTTEVTEKYTVKGHKRLDFYQLELHCFGYKYRFAFVQSDEVAEDKAEGEGKYPGKAVPGKK
jgi:hypothetical protein